MGRQWKFHSHREQLSNDTEHRALSLRPLVNLRVRFCDDAWWRHTWTASTDDIVWCITRQMTLCDISLDSLWTSHNIEQQTKEQTVKLHVLLLRQHYLRVAINSSFKGPWCDISYIASKCQQNLITSGLITMRISRKLHHFLISVFLQFLRGQTYRPGSWQRQPSSPIISRLSSPGEYNTVDEKRFTAGDPPVWNWREEIHCWRSAGVKQSAVLLSTKYRLQTI